MARILIVDDDPAGREMLASLVRYGGHDALVAADGAEALDIVRRERPALVISDILMPTMDGYEFVRRLRSEPPFAGIGVIFYTASYHEREAAHLAVTGGVARILLKPCEPADLIRAIEEVLSGAKEAARAAVPDDFDAEHLRLLTDKLWKRSGELEIANSRFTALAELNVQLASERDPRILLEQVCHGARKLFGARYAVLAARDTSGNHQENCAVSGLDPPTFVSARPAVDAGALGRVVAARKPWRVVRKDGESLDSGLPREFPPVDAYLAVPLASLKQCYGWICLAGKVGGDAFTAEDESLFATLGAQVGRIYENGSLYVELQRRASQLLSEMAQRESATEGLRLSEERFRQLAENIQDVFFLASGDLRELLYLSPAYTSIWGRSAAQPASCEDFLFSHVHPDDIDRLGARLRLVANGDRECDVEYRIVRPAGAIRWVHLRIFPVRGKHGDAARIVGTAKDITERRQAATRIEQLNRVYAVLSSINTLIVRVKDRDELFREACRLAVDHGKFALAWIGWLDEQTGKIPPVAWAGVSNDLVQSAVPELAADPAEDGIVAAAIRTGRLQVCNDIAHDARRVVFRDEMLARGYRAIIALPLVVAGKSAGCLVLTTEEADFFTADEQRLLTELADDTAFALDHISKGERLHYLAYYDALTGLANRTLFLDRLAQRLEHADRENRRIALIIMAPDRLSNINETFGRAAGDLVLAQFSRRYCEAVGSASDVARVSGDQLVAIVEFGGDESEVLRFVSRWQEQCFNPPFDFHGSLMRLAANCGVSVHPDDGADAENLLRNAEAALERAKVTGDEFLFYTHRMSVAVTQKLMLEHALREAHEKQEFVLYYQPKVNLESRRLTGLEALIRWNNAERGLVPPVTFIPLMEETGMIVAIGLWVMRQAARDRKRWLTMNVAAPRIAVNVSTIQLRRRDFVESVRLVMNDAGDMPGIDFEVTESLIMEDVDSNIRKLEEIRQMGISLALDDFGTGYSSLGYLSKLPVATLKIDRSFVTRMLEDPGAMTLVSTMIQLAHSLNLNVVAEGVETEEQAKILRLLRCDEIQGYLISKPLPFEEITEFLRAGGP